MPTSLHLRVRGLLDAALQHPTTLRTEFLRESQVNSVVLREALALLPHYAALAGITRTATGGAAQFLPGRATLARALGFGRDEPELRPPFAIAPYTVFETVGRGGMGVVYRAVDPIRRDEVAIKLLHEHMASADARWRFKHEEELLRQLKHPGIVRIRHGGDAQIVLPGDNGPIRIERPYFVMEYVHGSSLVEFAEKQSLTALQRIALFCDVCTAIEYAHQRGVIHRDLKPENILVDDAGRPRILDFGIARLQTFAPRPQSGPHFTGTIAYASPEQLAGQDTALTPASDVYTLGLLLHELLTGKLPRREIRLVHVDVRSVRLAESPPANPAEESAFRYAIHTVIATALRMTTARRYADAGALGADLSSIRDAYERPAGWGAWFAQFAARFRAARSAEPASHDRLLSVVLRRRMGMAMQNNRTDPDGPPPS